jgi:hypothetical protein
LRPPIFSISKFFTQFTKNLNRLIKEVLHHDRDFDVCLLETLLLEAANISSLSFRENSDVILPSLVQRLDVLNNEDYLSTP